MFLQSPDHPVFCHWHALPPAHHHPTHHTSPLDRVLNVLTSSEGLPPCHGDGDVGFEGMSNDIHTLLDHLPATTESECPCMQVSVLCYYHEMCL